MGLHGKISQYKYLLLALCYYVIHSHFQDDEEDDENKKDDSEESEYAEDSEFEEDSD